MAGSVGSLDDELSEGDSDGGADVSTGFSDLLGERVGLGSEAVTDPLGEGTSMEPSPPQEVRRTASSTPAADAGAAPVRFVPTVIMVVHALLWQVLLCGAHYPARFRLGGAVRLARMIELGVD